MAAPTPVQNTDVFNPALKSIRSIHRPFAVDVDVLATNDGTPTLATLKTGHTIYVTSIDVAVTTDNAATLTFQDSASTPVKIAATKASPGIGPLHWEFGELGTPCTAEKSLNMAISAAGLAARVHVEGYYRLTTVGSQPA